MSEKKIPAIVAIDLIRHFAILEIDNNIANRAIIAGWVDGYCCGLLRGEFINAESAEKIQKLLSNIRNYEKWQFLVDDIIEAMGGIDPTDSLAIFSQPRDDFDDEDCDDE